MSLLLIQTGGLSRRMGRAKVNLELYPGSSQTFLQRILEVTEGLFESRVVVSSLPPEEIIWPNEGALPTVIQERPEEGQLSSLLLGWEAYGKDHDWMAVCLVDHPYISRQTFEQILAAQRANTKGLAWTPSYHSRGGHPVVFSRELMNRLQKADLSLGARPVMRSLGQQRVWVEVTDPAILWDVDRPEDYERFSKAYQKLQLL